MKGKVHFFPFDARHCGRRETGQRVAVDPNKVTCPDCAAKDTFVLSPQGMATVRRLEAAARARHG